MTRLVARARARYRLYRYCGFSRRYALLRVCGVPIAPAERLTGELR